MDLIIDANILFAALIKEGKTRELIFKDTLHLFSAEYLFEELKAHEKEILEKTKNTKNDFETTLAILRKRIQLITLEELLPYLDKAETICPDPDDIVYFALALKLNCPIWSNDKALKKQESIKVYSTKELDDLV